MRDYLQRHAQLWLVIMCIAAFLSADQSPASSHGGDTWGTFLTAQALVEHGTFHVDQYYGTLISPDDARFVAQNGHRYDFFPIGSALLLAPFVWNENMRDHPMTRPDDMRAFENTISALSVALASVLIYAVARGALPESVSLLLAAIFTFGSAVMSTMGSAFWSINPALLCSLGIAALLVRDAQGTRPLNPYILGLLLFTAYLCRPSLSLLIGSVGIYLLIVRRPQFWRLLATLAVCAAGFILFSLIVYGSYLPPYYLPQRLFGADTFWMALFGNLFSPARGLFVFSPFLIVLIVGIVVTARTLARQPLFWMALGWFLLHWIVVARFPQWWGGYSFGSRLMADILPAMLILSLLVWQAWSAQLAPYGRRLVVGALIATGLASGWINTAQGLWNRETMNWNVTPDIDRYPEYVFDWRYPQFLASPAMQERRQADHELNRLLQLQPQAITGRIPLDSPAYFLDWYMAERSDGEQFRWSEGETSSLVLRLDETRRTQPLIFSLLMGSSGPQRVEMWLNGRPLGVFDQPGYTPRRYTALMSPDWVQTAGMAQIPYAELELYLPGVQRGADGRSLGVRLVELTVAPPQP